MKKIKIETERKSFPIKQIFELISSLEPGIARYNISENLKHYTFMKDKIATFNGSQLVIVPFNTGFKGSVDAKKLSDLIKKFDASMEDISFTHNKNKGTLLIKSGKLKGTLNWEKSKENIKTISTLLNMKKGWKKFPKEVKQAVSLSSFCVSTDVTIPELTGVYVGKKIVCASQNHRQVKFTNSFNIKSFVLPGISSSYLPRYKIKKYALTDNWVFFKTKDGIIFASTILSLKNYPIKKTLKRFDSIKKGKVYSFPKSTAKVIDRVATLVSDEFVTDRKIELKISGNKMEVIATSEGRGKYTETIKLDWSVKKEISMLINPTFLIEALSHSLTFQQTENMIILRSDNFEHIINLHKKQ